MRGTPHRAHHHSHRRRIIPAYAGNTYGGEADDVDHRDHPRVCGEHTCVTPASASWTGSSPRMRGTPLQGMYSNVCTGIIPAYAGNTSSQCNGMSLSWDHPRVCGEHWHVTFQNVSGLGSSPRMRGTPGQVRFGGNECGIIPAYAGNTLGGGHRGRPERDHPRVCGEHSKRLA